MSTNTQNEELTKLSVHVPTETLERIDAAAKDYVPGGVSRSHMTRILLLEGLDSHDQSPGRPVAAEGDPSLNSTADVA